MPRMTSSAPNPPAEGKSNLMDCTPAELDEVIRCTITTGPWNVSDSKEDAAGQSEQDAFNDIVQRMRQRGYRLTTGEEYAAELRRRQHMRPDVIPLWKPINPKEALSRVPTDHSADVTDASSGVSSSLSCDSDRYNMSSEEDAAAYSYSHSRYPPQMDPGYSYNDAKDEDAKDDYDSSHTVTTHNIRVSIPFTAGHYQAGTDTETGTGTSSSVYAAMPDKKKSRCYTQEYNGRMDTSLSNLPTEEWATPQPQRDHYTEYRK